jgi:tetratricopeptide (TPR) repeat protein
LSDYSKVIELEPKYARAYYMRGQVWHRKKEYDKAIQDQSESIRLNPKYVWSYYHRALTWKTKGEFEKMTADYNKIISLDPKCASAYNNLAWFLATCPDAKYRDGVRAVEHATQACELTEWKTPNHLGTLAAAYAEIGEFDKAIEYQKKALEIASESYNKQGAQERLALYEAGTPYRDNR